MFNFSIFPTQTYRLNLSHSSEMVLQILRKHTTELGSDNQQNFLFEGEIGVNSFKISLLDKSSALLKQPFPTIYGKLVADHDKGSTWEIGFYANRLYAFVLLLILINNFYLAAKKGYSWGYYGGMAIFFFVFYSTMFLVNRNHSRNSRMQLEELLSEGIAEFKSFDN